MSGTAAGFTARRLAAHAADHGVPAGTVAGWFGLRGEEAELPARVPIERLYAAWAALARALGDAAVGVRCALGWSVADLELFGFCVATAPTAGAATETAVRYAALVTDSGAWCAEGEERGLIAMSWRRAGPLSAGRSVSNEVAVASFAVCFRELTGANAVAVELRHRPAQRTTVHRDLLGCPVRFGASRDRVLLARADLAIVPRQANAALWRFLTGIADDEVGRVRPRGTADRVAGLLAAALDAGLGELPSVAAAARALGLSERTLRRRLGEEATCFRALCDRARRVRAEELLAGAGATVTEVAAASGFADASALGHAWQRWYGGPPSKSRR